MILIHKVECNLSKIILTQFQMNHFGSNSSNAFTQQLFLYSHVEEAELLQLTTIFRFFLNHFLLFLLSYISIDFVTRNLFILFLDNKKSLLS